ncbi:DUF2470 domain-containing protein [Nocardioides coralli]|uniref:DUF2470 domain-containing protein n=1 Tax=Nocardioides coralli TaxID=2872154 RepID=UPI001CA38767|nr:DUF2470 domain-containing protein [Nocardioides coralli]QZY29507.1 hypothetical protein K6T13_02065 [Nocardioides coralli]
MTGTSEPTWAERARTALAQATTGSLLTRECRSTANLTAVTVHDQVAGTPAVWLSPDSPVVARLAACPVATLVVPAPLGWVLHLTGTFAPLRDTTGEHCGCRGYRPTLLGVRLVGPARVSIPVAEFLAAQPDPLRDDAATMLHHLEEAHAADLLACVRAHGHDALAVVPRAIDRYGIELAAIAADGVDRLRLAFPGGPLEGLDRLNSGWRLPMSCRCASRPA